MMEDDRFLSALSRRTTLAGLLGLVSAPAAAANDAAAPWAKVKSGDAASAIPFIRVYDDADDRVRIERSAFRITTEPIKGLLMQPAETVAIRVIPPGTFFDWHKPSRPRLIAVLRGVVVMTLRDGTSETVEPGTLALIENTKGEGHRGHFDPKEFTITVDVGLPVNRIPS
jgi:quercetin dioxygenase-like cupin family protein